jgi:hypothetical protein
VAAYANETQLKNPQGKGSYQEYHWTNLNFSQTFWYFATGGCCGPWVRINMDVNGLIQ